MSVFHLSSVECTLLFGRLMARALAEVGSPGVFFLEGDLGAGKTTLVRALVENLPGGDQAEVSSPSFNIMNIYPTTPQIAHFDLYRLEHQYPGDELLDYLDDEDVLVVAEWSQYLEKQYWPDDFVHINLQNSESGGRNLILTVAGDAATAYTDRVTSLADDVFGG